MEKTNNLFERKGCVIFSREILTVNPNEDMLKAIFTNFYPVSTEVIGFYEHVKMYGYSPHFRTLKPDENLPTYEMVFQTDSSGNTYLLEVNEIKEEN